MRISERYEVPIVFVICEYFCVLPNLFQDPTRLVISVRALNRSGLCIANKYSTQMTRNMRRGISFVSFCGRKPPTLFAGEQSVSSFCLLHGERSTKPAVKRPNQRFAVVAVTANDGLATSASSSNKKQYVKIEDTSKTNGGWIVDAEVVNFTTTTSHTVVVGKLFLDELCGEANVPVPSPESAVTWVFEYFMSTGFDISNTAGLLDAGAFPINYFSLRQVFYFFEDAKESLINYIKNEA